MKILILSGLYPPHYHGGYEINCEAKAKGLERRGHEVIVLTSTYGVDRQTRDGNVFRYLHPLAAASHDGFSKRLAQVKNAILGRINYQITKKIVERMKPELAYVWQLSNVSIFPAIAASDRNIPAVYELGDYWLLQNKIDFMLEKSRLKRLFRNTLFGGYGFARLDFSNMITISTALKRSYLEGKFTGDNIAVIPRGIPNELVVKGDTYSAPTKKKVFRLLIAGRIVEEKGAHIAISAVRLLLDALPETKIFLDLIGNGNANYLQKLHELTNSLKLQDCVMMKGQIPHNELMDEYINYDVFLFPSIWEEPLGNTILEAMAKGVPVVASRVGGVPDMIEHGSNGLLVAPDNPIELADAVKRLLDDSTLYSSIRAAAIRTVLEKFTREVIDGQTENYLLNLRATRGVEPSKDRRVTH